MFKKAGSLIKLSARYRKSGDAISAIAVRQVARSSIERILRDYPEEIFKKIQIKTYKGGVLTIVCPPAMSSELYMRSGELIGEINKAARSSVVKEIKFRAG